MFLLYANPHELARLTWTGSPGGTWAGIRDSLRYPLRLLAIRLNRERHLRYQVDGQIATSAAIHDADLLRRIHAVPQPVPRWEWLREFADITSSHFYTGASSMISDGWGKLQLTLSVLISDLNNAPMPVDIFSSTGAPLKPIERHGQIIGWYSVGPNGIDDGGDRSRDFGIALSASFGKPKFADEPEPRPEQSAVPKSTSDSKP